MKMARLAPSLSWSICGMVLGLPTQNALDQEMGRSFDHMLATSLNWILLAVWRFWAMEAVADSMPWGLPTPLPWRKANSSNQPNDPQGLFQIRFSSAELLAAQ